MAQETEPAESELDLWLLASEGKLKNIPPDMVIVQVLEKTGWSYQQLMDIPAVIVDHLLAKWRAEAMLHSKPKPLAPQEEEE